MTVDSLTQRFEYLNMLSSRLLRTKEPSQSLMDWLLTKPIRREVGSCDSFSLLMTLRKVATDFGVVMVPSPFADNPQALGSYHPVHKELWVDSCLSYDHQLRVIVHELAHAVTVDWEPNTYLFRNTARLESLAELTAAAVLNELGYDMTNIAECYLAGLYISSSSFFEDVNCVVMDAAHVILEAMKHVKGVFNCTGIPHRPFLHVERLVAS